MKRTTYKLSILIVTSVSILLSERTTSQAAPAPQPLDLQHVSLFKNGLGFFVGRIECPADETSFEVALPTAPSHGTFWVSYAPSLPLANILARQVDAGRLAEAVTVPEILKANVGRQVRLAIGDKEITGAITHVAQGRHPPVRNPYQPGAREIERSYVPAWQGIGLITLETEGGELSVNLNAVTQVTFVDGKADRQFTEPGQSVALHVRLKSPAPGQKLTISYLGKGLTWAPSYLVDITDGRMAHLSAKAVIVNDACELKDVDAQLVTGFPHLQFADTASPIALKENLAQFLQALVRGQSERGRADIMSNVMTQSVRYGDMREQGAMPAYGAADAGTIAEDLFLYPAGPIHLGTNEVAYIPLFTETVPYVHIYQWDIPDYVDEDGQSRYRGQDGGNAEDQQVVWHSIRLTNTTKVPWTTAPGQTMKEGIILGQDTLSYTPSGAENTLRITQAVGVKAEQREFETDRKRDAAQLYGYHYDLVTVQGELSAGNFQDKAITLEITKMLSGEVESMDPKAEIEKQATGLRRMNGLSKLTWTLELDPGQRKAVQYVYSVYVRR